jgi:benzoyl-CoA 2,3-dioxygenase component B
MFTDRDGKFQLLSRAESGFDPLARTCRFMLTEEAHHMFVGQTGVGRVVQRTAELMQAHPGAQPARRRRASTCHAAEVRQLLVQQQQRPLRRRGPSNSANFFGSSLKGRAWEMKKHTSTPA